MKFLILAALLASFLFSTHACRCVPTNIKKTYFDRRYEYIVRATVEDISEPCRPTCNSNILETRRYLLKVKKVFKGCNVPLYIWVKSPPEPSECGIILQKGVDYLLPIDRRILPDMATINSCQYIRTWSRLTNAERFFLDSRMLCCNGVCECNNKKPPVRCFVRPCLTSKKPCDEATKCVDNYCGACRAEWFTKTGQPACQ